MSIEQKITRKNAAQFIHAVMELTAQVKAGKYPQKQTPRDMAQAITTFALEAGLTIPQECPGAAHMEGGGLLPTCCICIGSYSYGLLGKTVKVV